MDPHRSPENNDRPADGSRAAGPYDPQRSAHPAGDGDLHIPPRPPLPEQSAAAAAAQPPQQPAYGDRPYTDAGHGQQPAQAYGGYGDSFGPAATGATERIDDGTAASERAAAKRRSGAGKVTALVVAAALVGGAAGLGTSWAGSQLWASPSNGGASGPSTVTVNNPGSVNETTGVAAEVLPSVVTIEASDGSQGGSGSGVIVSEDGYIVTNTHVVTLGGAANDATLRVTTSDGHIYEAEIVGTDPTYDLAVIKLKDAEGLTPVEYADSSKLNVGSSAVAVGAPLGLSNTVTTGIVSALNRSIEIASAAAPEGDQAQPEDGQDAPFFFDFPGQQEQQQQQASESISISVLQTDAAINPGNSGGALVDSQGRLIGINVAIATAQGASSSEAGSIGVGFAIPSNVVERVANEIIETGSATHGLLGASVMPASAAEDATVAGAYIAEISPGGAAEQAGLRKGDIVTKFNGVPITSAVDLTAQVRAAAAESEASLTYVRGGENHTVDLTLGTLE